MMKTLLLIPVLICAASMLAFMPPTEAPTAHRITVNPVAYVGKLVGWSVSADGNVAVHLEGTLDNEAFSLWFTTPANRNATTRFESLVLDSVLAIAGTLADLPVTVISDRSGDESGKSIEDALTLHSIGQR